MLIQIQRHDHLIMVPSSAARIRYSPNNIKQTQLFSLHPPSITLQLLSFFLSFICPEIKDWEHFFSIFELYKVETSYLVNQKVKVKDILVMKVKVKFSSNCASPW